MVVSPQWQFHGFLVHWVKRRPDFFMRKPFLGFLLSFFINYVAMSTFCIRDKLFNEDINHYQYTIGTALRVPHISSPCMFFRKNEKNSSPKVSHIPSPSFGYCKTTVTCAQKSAWPGSVYPEFPFSGISFATTCPAARGRLLRDLRQAVLRADQRGRPAAWRARHRACRHGHPGHDPRAPGGARG